VKQNTHSEKWRKKGAGFIIYQNTSLFENTVIFIANSGNC